MIPNKSKQTSSVLEQKVILDILEKGWMSIPCPPETQFDVIADLGVQNGKRKLVTIQVKQTPRTTSRPNDAKNESRNSYSYYDVGVDYLATEEKGKIVYIHRDDFRYLKEGELKRVRRTPFPVNENMFSYRKPVDKKIDSTLKEFFA